MANCVDEKKKALSASFFAVENEAAEWTTLLHTAHDRNRGSAGIICQYAGGAILNRRQQLGPERSGQHQWRLSSSNSRVWSAPKALEMSRKAIQIFDLEARACSILL
ncbi:hypothetical protein CEXT_111111 [Caerostris extrusa]|uniref:Uncharacterized protein n=1 Tax=Caerostris extrusa TaxID=172846 RepID=A0AAV4MXC7_CAEEX|nr:hypothetical protein CEXT_111111 [Caerostris extrusa]